MSRPKITWDDKQYKQFEVMCGLQCTQQEICNVLDIDHKTLYRLLKTHYNADYSQVYNKYASTGKLTLRRYQYKLAERSPAMAIFLGKVYLEQREDNRNIETQEEDNLFNAIEKAVKSDV